MMKTTEKRNRSLRQRLNLVVQLSYRVPAPVTTMRVYRDNSGYYVCPRCDTCLENDYVAYCGHCGQCLNWTFSDHAKPVYIGRS